MWNHVCFVTIERRMKYCQCIKISKSFSLYFVSIAVFKTASKNSLALYGSLIFHWQVDWYNSLSVSLVFSLNKSSTYNKLFCFYLTKINKSARRWNLKFQILFHIWIYIYYVMILFWQIYFASNKLKKLYEKLINNF